MSKPKKPKLPPTPAPTPMVMQPDIEKEDRKRRKLLSSLGRGGTVLVPYSLGDAIQGLG